MTSDPRADVVVGQYERWVYPEPIEDLPAWLKHNWQWFDPSHAHHVFWPDRGYRSDLQILVAGCGTNQAAVLAYTNPGATILAIDVSEPSLHHHRVLKERYGLRNLELQLLPIEEVGSLGREFDLIISTGVLHHLADPQAGTDALAQCLREDGVMALMLYAHYGRIGVEIMESVFAQLGLRQDAASIAIVTQALQVLPKDHPLRSYLSLAPDLDFDAGIVDTFLHGRERSFTVDECLALVEDSGLVFQDWFLKSPYEPAPGSDNEFLEAVADLPDRERWSVMERINTRNGCHFFMACRADRPSSHYRIAFTDSEFTRLVPCFRYRCELQGHDLVLPGTRITLTPQQHAVVSLIDGRRTIADLATQAAQGGQDPQVVAGLIRFLWEQDALAVRLNEIP